MTPRQRFTCTLLSLTLGCVSPPVATPDDAGRPAPDGATMPVSDDTTPTRALLAESSDVRGRRPLRLEPRDGGGGFRLVVRPLADGATDFVVWERELGCAHRGIGPGVGADELVQSWLGCAVPGVTGTLSLSVHFLRVGEGETRIRVMLDNQLADASLVSVAVVHRLAAESMPADPERELYARFLFDAWIPNPLDRMRANREVTTHALPAPIGEPGGDDALYRNRNKATPTLSVHTPDWGLLVHTLDAANTDTGELLLGSGETDGGERRMDFGYEARLSNVHLPGNGGGRMRVGPDLRSVVLPADPPVSESWWEAAEAYRQFLEAESPELLPSHRAASAPWLAPWAGECVYTVRNIGRERPGRPGALEVVDPEAFIEEMRRLATFFGQGLGSEETLHVCPLLWGVASYAPYRLAEGAREVLLGLAELERELPAVELHPLFYVDTSCAHPGSAAIPDEAFDRTASGEYAHRCTHETNAWTVHNGHPAVRAELDRFVDEALDIGFEGVYHDAPFGEHRAGAASGANRGYGEGIRESIRAMNRALSERGGGVVVVEDGRLGLDAIQSRVFPLAYPFFDDVAGVPFAASVLRGHHLVGMAGGDGNGAFQIGFADASVDERVRSGCTPRPRGGARGFEPGVPDNVWHIPRLAIRGAVEGRTVMDPRPGFWKPASATQPPLAAYAAALREAAHLRRRVPALRYGRAVAPPPSDTRWTTVATRHLTGHDPGGPYACEVAERRVPEVEHALYEDPEDPRALVLVVGNAMRTPRRVSYGWSAARYAGLGETLTVLDEAGGVLFRGASGVVGIDVPAFGFRVLRVVGEPISD